MLQSAQVVRSVAFGEMLQQLFHHTRALREFLLELQNSNELLQRLHVITHSQLANCWHCGC